MIAKLYVLETQRNLSFKKHIEQLDEEISVLKKEEEWRNQRVAFRAMMEKD